MKLTFLFQKLFHYHMRTKVLVIIRKNTLAGIAAFCISFLFFSCTKKFAINQPTEFYNKLISSKEPSSFTVLASFPIKDLEKTANARVPTMLYEDNNIEDDNYTLKVGRRGDIQIKPKGDLIFIKIPIEIYAKTQVNLGFFKSSYDANFQLNVNYYSKISATSDWKIITTTTSNGFEWITQPTIKIGPLELNISAFVEKKFNEELQRFSFEIDKIIAEKISLKEYVDQAWNTLQTPIEIQKDNNSWVKITPNEVFFIPPFGDTTLLKTGIKINCIAETFFGRKPETSLLPLPLLKIANASSDSFNLNLSMQLSFKYAAELAKLHLKGKNFSFQDGKKNINITDLELYGSGEKVVAKTTIEGDFKGIIYFAGIPQYDSATACIKINKLDFSIDTKNKLFKAANWFAHGTLVKKMEKEFVFPVKDQIEEAKVKMNKALLNNKINNFLTINGQLNSVTPKKLYIIEDFFLLQIQSKGKLSLDIGAF